MTARLVPGNLASGVGRRVLVLFLLAALVPVLFTGGLAFREFDRGAENRAYDELRSHAKVFGIDIFERLSVVADRAREAAGIVAGSGNEVLSNGTYLLDDFSSIFLIAPQKEAVVIVGDEQRAPVVGDVDRAFLAGGGTQLIIDNTGGRAGMLMVRELQSPFVDAALLVYRLDSERIWGEAEDLPFGTDFCVFLSSGSALFCSPQGQNKEQQLRRYTGNDASLLHEWTDTGQDFVATDWQLFLEGEFRAPPFDIVAAQTKALALQSNTDFRRIFLPALLLVFILVGLLSFNMIGRSLGPLQRLTDAARQFASGDLSRRVDVSTGDEFEALAGAFNNMAGKLGQQIEMLKAMSGIDRRILAGASFDDVSRNLVSSLLRMMNCNAAAVVAQDDTAQGRAKLIFGDSNGIDIETIAMPDEFGHKWTEPTQVALADVDEKDCPYKRKFRAASQDFVVVVPVILHEDLKGLLLIGSPAEIEMSTERLQPSVELASRFAVALSSVEREEALYRQANFDELTGLPNRQLMKAHLSEMIERVRRTQGTGALLYLDLDRFKEINDVYGHSVGDIVLTQAAQRIVNEVCSEDMVSRLGGDEFVVILPKIIGDDMVTETASRLLTRLTEIFSVFGINHFVGASIGIVMFPSDGDSVETLLKNADAAMYRAKDAGRARYEFFNIELNTESQRKVELERDLRAGFADGQLEVYYQPQFSVADESISGAEALLRWRHPAHGYVSPAEFIPLAEDSNLIVEIGHWVFEQVCKDLRSIIDQGLHPGSVSVNISPRQLNEEGLVDSLMHSLRSDNIHPGYMQLELTETAVAQNSDTAIELLTELRSRGLRIAMDDFGTGYSSLSYLQNMPLDTIKIDKSFVDRIGTGLQSDNICKTVISMAQALDKKSVAEGVETAEQVDFLREHGCDIIQGYYYSKPLALAEFTAFIRKQDYHTQRRKALEII